MIVVATQKYTRQTARKVRYVADVVKKMSVEDALKQLAVMERRASLVVLKTLRQAIANAMNNHQMAIEDLKIKNIVVDEAPTYKRWRAVSRGRAHTILKRSCHVKVELISKEAAKEAKKAEEKPTAKAKLLKKAQATKQETGKKAKITKRKTATKVKTSKEITKKKTAKKITNKDKK